MQQLAAMGRGNPTARGQGHDNRLYNSIGARNIPLTRCNQTTAPCLRIVGLDYHTSITGDSVQPAHGYLKSAAVLTCLATAPPSGAFRPGFRPNKEKFYTTYQMSARVYLEVFQLQGILKNQHQKMQYQLMRISINAHGYTTGQIGKGGCCIRLTTCQIITARVLALIARL